MWDETSLSIGLSLDSQRTTDFWHEKSIYLKHKLKALNTTTLIGPKGQNTKVSMEFGNSIYYLYKIFIHRRITLKKIEWKLHQRPGSSNYKLQWHGAGNLVYDRSLLHICLVKMGKKIHVALDQIPDLVFQRATLEGPIYLVCTEI